MAILGNFVISISYNCNCIMSTCCTFAFLIKFDFNSSIATSFAFTFMVTFYCNPSMVISCNGLLSSILSIKTFELKFKLFRNVFRLASSSKLDDMLRKVIWNEDEL